MRNFIKYSLKILIFLNLFNNILCKRWNLFSLDSRRTSSFWRGIYLRFVIVRPFIQIQKTLESLIILLIIPSPTPVQLVDTQSMLLHSGHSCGVFVVRRIYLQTTVTWDFLLCFFREHRRLCSFSSTSSYKMNSLLLNVPFFDDLTFYKNTSISVS